MKAKHRKRKKILILFGLLLSFVIVEIGLRGAGYVFYRSNLRRNNASRDYAKRTVRILCVGDSFTAGLGASHDTSYPAHLDRVLRRNNPDMRFVVYNCGIPGQISSELSERLNKNLQRFMPDLLIVLVGVNDNPAGSNYWLFADIKDIGIKTYFLQKINYFLSKLRSYELLKTLVLNLRNKATPENKNFIDVMKEKVGINEQEIPELRDFGGLDLAKEQIEEALRVMKEDSSINEEGLIELVNLFIDKRRYDLAKEQIGEVLRMNPGCERAYLCLLKLYREEEKFDLGIQEADRIMRVNPNNSRAYVELGRIHFRLGKKDPAMRESNWKLAEEYFKKALELNSKDGDLYYVLGDLYFESGKPDLAAEIAKRALEIFPDDPLFKDRLYSYTTPVMDRKTNEILQKMYRYDLENIIKLARTQNTEVILLNYPEVGYLDDIRKNLAGKYGIAFVDIFSAFNSLLEIYEHSEIFSGDGHHCNSKGYEFMAEEIYKKLKSSSILGIK